MEKMCGVTDSFRAHCREILANADRWSNTWPSAVITMIIVRLHHSCYTASTMEDQLNLPFCLNASTRHPTGGLTCESSAGPFQQVVKIVSPPLVSGYASIINWVFPSSAGQPQLPQHHQQWLTATRLKIPPGNPHQISLIVLTALRDDWSGSRAHCWRSPSREPTRRHQFRLIWMGNWHLGCLLHRLKVESKLIYSVFTGLAVQPHSSQASEKVGITASTYYLTPANC